jgi:hypothetical protein
MPRLDWFVIDETVAYTPEQWKAMEDVLRRIEARRRALRTRLPEPINDSRNQDWD